MALVPVQHHALLLLWCSRRQRSHSSLQASAMPCFFISPLLHQGRGWDPFNVPQLRLTSRQSPALQPRVAFNKSLGTKWRGRKQAAVLFINLFIYVFPFLKCHCYPTAYVHNPMVRWQVRGLDPQLMLKYRLVFPWPPAMAFFFLLLFAASFIFKTIPEVVVSICDIPAI